jgi:hypothetical protein
MKPVSTRYLLFLGPKCFLAADILGVNLMKKTCNNTIVMRLTYAIIIIIFFLHFVH